jgi:hypothetical protein
MPSIKEEILYKEPLRKRFAKRARHGALNILISTSVLAGVPAGIGYGAWYAGNTIMQDPWDYAPIEFRDQGLEKLETEFNKLSVLEHNLKTIKSSREMAYDQNKNAEFQSLTIKMLSARGNLKSAVGMYARHLITARDIDEKDYQKLGDQFKSSTLNGYSEINLNTSWGEASARRECNLAENYNFSAQGINRCMREHKDNIIPLITIIPSALALFLIGALVGPNPVPKRWEKLSDRRHRGGGKRIPSLKTIRNRMRHKILFLRPKRPGN